MFESCKNCQQIFSTLTITCINSQHLSNNRFSMDFSQHWLIMPCCCEDLAAAQLSLPNTKLSLTKLWPLLLEFRENFRLLLSPPNFVFFVFVSCYFFYQTESIGRPRLQHNIFSDFSSSEKKCLLALPPMFGKVEQLIAQITKHWKVYSLVNEVKSVWNCRSPCRLQKKHCSQFSEFICRITMGFSAFVVVRGHARTTRLRKRTPRTEALSWKLWKKYWQFFWCSWNATQKSIVRAIFQLTLLYEFVTMAEYVTSLHTSVQRITIQMSTLPQVILTILFVHERGNSGTLRAA